MKRTKKNQNKPHAGGKKSKTKLKQAEKTSRKLGDVGKPTDIAPQTEQNPLNGQENDNSVPIVSGTTSNSAVSFCDKKDIQQIHTSEESPQVSKSDSTESSCTVNQPLNVNTPSCYKSNEDMEDLEGEVKRKENPTEAKTKSEKLEAVAISAEQPEQSKTTNDWHDPDLTSPLTGEFMVPATNTNIVLSISQQKEAELQKNKEELKRVEQKLMEMAKQKENDLKQRLELEKERKKKEEELMQRKEELNRKEKLAKRRDNRVFFGEDNEYIEGTWHENQLTEVSAVQFIHPTSRKIGYLRKQKSGYLFTYDNDDFVARVSIDRLDQLDFTKTAREVQQNLLKCMRVFKVLEDKTMEERNEAYELLKQTFRRRCNQSSDQIDCAEDVYQLFPTFARAAQGSLHTFLVEVMQNDYISNDLKGSVGLLAKLEAAFKEKNNDFSRVDHQQERQQLSQLQEIHKAALAQHKKDLEEKFLWSIAGFALKPMMGRLEELEEKSALFYSKKDLNLYADLLSMLKEHFHEGLVSKNYEALFNNQMNTRQHSQSLKKVAPLTHPIYFYLCKSFQELAEEISIKTDMALEDLYKKNNKGDWELATTIRWPNSASLLSQCLEQQYRFIHRLMKHYEPGEYTHGKKFTRFYKLQKSLLDLRFMGEALHGVNDDDSFMQSVKNLVMGNHKVPEEYIIWTYLFDEAIAGLFDQSDECASLFESLIRGFKDFINKAKDDQYELFRVATHNTARFIAHTCPYLMDNVSSTDKMILESQIDSINGAIKSNHVTSFKDLIDIYNEFWKHRETIVANLEDKFPHGSFRNFLRNISAELLVIANGALKAKENERPRPDEVVTFFRSFNEFLEDLDGLDFVWYVKRDSECSSVEVVNADKRSYKVINPELFFRENNETPDHYMLKTIDRLLACVDASINNQEWSRGHVLKAASELLGAIRKSFLYFKEQSDYESFQIFEDENVTPFSTAVQNSSTYSDFCRRIEIVGDSFWYLRKQDEIDIGKALELFKDINDDLGGTELLRTSYAYYLEKFTDYIEQTVNKRTSENKIKFIIKDIKAQVKLFCVHDKLSIGGALNAIGITTKTKISDWGVDFKQKYLPKLLAGLSVVWSILASKDISSTGKSLKPHCIQILCILRLLSVDKGTSGVDKHLTQVLTGQGKSLVLGLLSALLALLGHRVRNMCYSKYLASRDQQDFNEFFRLFDVQDKITYGTFEEMANSIFNPEVDGRSLNIRTVVDDRIKSHTRKRSGKIKSEDISNTVLLIDEVDVFFSDQFYGNVYIPCTAPGFDALATIQIKIWEMAKEKTLDKTSIITKIKDFISKEESETFKEFQKFLTRPATYGILIMDKTAKEKLYTNQSLFNEHLTNMVTNAMSVATGTSNDWWINRFRLNTKGNIVYRKFDGTYSNRTFSGYYNVFNYFRLKKVEYDHRNFKNFGYFNINCGMVSYAKLPEKYPLILGVSGTLKTLNEQERKAVSDTYGIKKISCMPSFFGRSNLHFDTWTDFTCENAEDNWLCRIFKSANTVVSQARSVIIFFDTDIQLNKFNDKYLGKFDRLHLLTLNTKDHIKKKYIDEAGVTKTVTLATRHLGRGIDFKSSVAVEKHGGVHVIQTFFSLDAKEETQIKGRTARKDNKGSYELIVCQLHLKKDGFVTADQETSVTYDMLHTKRVSLFSAVRENDKKRIENSEESHKVTMKYFESFFY